MKKNISHIIIILSITVTMFSGNIYAGGFTESVGCATASALPGSVQCVGNPVTVTVQSGLGFSLGYLGASLSSNLSPTALKQIKNATCGSGGFLFWHMDCRDSNGNEIAWANGGGIVAGGFEGSASFS